MAKDKKWKIAVFQNKSSFIVGVNLLIGKIVPRTAVRFWGKKYTKVTYTDAFWILSDADNKIETFWFVILKTGRIPKYLSHSILWVEITLRTKQKERRASISARRAEAGVLGEGVGWQFNTFNRRASLWKLIRCCLDYHQLDAWELLEIRSCHNDWTI